ncbi:UDP-N-acetylglucosamine--N-acetylmuramyl-(pentapeptide) pyrophosphoryl-undecaprenol N-acetylglucosamine transferase [Pelagibacterales bacterium SAG-MED39]|nr:UDP-N-acetylglucosamine--N-acetylmuramyl-(pentapeptide) pyrophosphoryl-undecaprenol N-acetylglucosamine transferase [Pelagibacterales bacterium SAG-MED39]
MKKNILITTGGSGGHVIPATIFYEHLLKKTSIIISTDKRGLKYLDKTTSQFEIIDTPKLNNIFLLPLNVLIILFLTIKSFFLLKNKKINKIISTGGYMSLPIILAAKLSKLKIYLFEPNQVLGRANKFFLKSCEKIFCYTDHIKNFPHDLKNKMIIINPLVREDIYKIKNSFTINDKFTFLIVGGSQGASIFDINLKNSIVNISKKIPIKIIQQTYEKNISSLSNFYSKNNIENKIFSFDLNFIDNIQQADLCITRAGASTLAELSVTNTPFIAVPLPSSKDNHQIENANFYKNNDCCWIIEQKNFEDEIEDFLRSILTNKKDYLKKKENLKKLNYQNTWINVNQKILKIINEN